VRARARACVGVYVRPQKFLSSDSTRGEIYS